MQLTKRQEKQLQKVFENPKKLRKWIDEVDADMQRHYDKIFNDRIAEYLNIYGIVVAYTSRKALKLGKKRLPEFMESIWTNLENFKTEKLTLEDCIKELEQCGFSFSDVLNNSGQIVEKENKDDK